MKSKEEQEHQQELKEAKVSAKAEGITIGEVNGIKKTVIDLLKISVNDLSLQTPKLLNNCNINQLNQLKSKIYHILNEDDIINIIDYCQ